MIFATNGAKLYIGSAVPGTGQDVAADYFADQTWTEIGEVESIGSTGDTAQEVEFTAIGDRRRQRLKGTRDGGTMEAVMGIDYSDAGQLALLAAEKTDENYAFRIVFKDAPAGGTPSERMLFAIVGSATEALDAANNVMKLNASLWVNSNVVKINAAGA